MSKNRQLILTDGPILKTLTSLALPIMASSFLSTAYNITDMAWIGMLGSKAVAGVGVGGMYVWLSQGLVSLARMGGQVHVAQCCGSGEKEEARNYAACALQLTLAFGIVFALICLIFTNPLISFFQMNDRETFHYARIYMQITCGLILFSFMNLTLTGLFTAQGDSRTPFKANLIGLLTNMVLDPVLILGVGPFPGLGVAGAAIATVFAQLLVMMVMLWNIFRTQETENVMRKIRIYRLVPVGYYLSVCRMGGPTALQGTLYCMISMVLTRMVSGFGPGAVATQRVGGQIESISWNTADGFGAALNAFVGQNYGAGKYERIQNGYKISLRIMIFWGILVTALFVLLPRNMAQLFFYEKDVISIAVDYMRILGIGEGFMCVELMTVGALSGLGRTKECSVISIVLTGARIPLAIILTKAAGFGLNGIWLALTISSVVKGFVFWFTFKKISRKLV